MRTAKVENKLWIANVVDTLSKKKELPVSYHLARQIEAAGFIEPVFKKSMDGGRDRKTYVPSEKGRKLLAAIAKF